MMNLSFEAQGSFDCTNLEFSILNLWQGLEHLPKAVPKRMRRDEPRLVGEVCKACFLVASEVEASKKPPRL